MNADDAGRRPPRTRFDFIVAAAALVTVLLGMDWPFAVRVVLCPAAVGLWLLAVVRRA